MSNVARINIRFSLDEPDQKKAYDILKAENNQSSFIRRAILDYVSSQETKPALENGNQELLHAIAEEIKNSLSDRQQSADAEVMVRELQKVLEQWLTRLEERQYNQIDEELRELHEEHVQLQEVAAQLSMKLELLCEKEKSAVAPAQQEEHPTREQRNTPLGFYP